jgi:hypothetical protein
MESLLRPICHSNNVYFVELLVFFDELFEVGTRVADLLLAGIEDYLTRVTRTTFWEDMCLNWYLKNQSNIMQPTYLTLHILTVLTCQATTIETEG